MISATLSVACVVVIAGARWAASPLFQASPQDSGVCITATATLLAVAVLASVIPALRAIRVDPTFALRAE